MFACIAKIHWLSGYGIFLENQKKLLFIELRKEEWSPTGKACGTSFSLAESAEAYPPTHKALDGFSFLIYPRLKAVVFCEGG